MTTCFSFSYQCKLHIFVAFGAFVRQNEAFPLARQILEIVIDLFKEIIEEEDR